MTFDDLVKEAFLDELRNIYAARGQEMPKLALDQRIDAMIKEANFLRAIGSGIASGARKAGGAIAKPIKAVHKKVSPAQRELTKYKDLGVGDVAEASLKKQQPLRRAEAWGKAKRQTPIARVAEARKAAKTPHEKALLTVKGDKASKMKQVEELNKATEQIGGTSRSGRILGAGVEGAAGHTRHHTIGRVINPIGTPMGGGIEGMTRQIGREFSSAGHKGVGGALKRQAGKVGLVGEVAGLAGMGTAAHLPMSAAGVLGGKMSGGLAAAAPALADVAGHVAEPLGHAGKVLAHGAEDAMGMATKKVPALAGRGLTAMKSIGSRILGRAPQAVGG
jgi:hypothetical protein